MTAIHSIQWKDHFVSSYTLVRQTITWITSIDRFCFHLISNHVEITAFFRVYTCAYYWHTSYKFIYYLYWSKISVESKNRIVFHENRFLIDLIQTRVDLLPPMHLGHILRNSMLVLIISTSIRNFLSSIPIWNIVISLIALWNVIRLYFFRQDYPLKVLIDSTIVNSWFQF